MVSETLKAGEYFLKSFKIRKLNSYEIEKDIVGLIHTWEFSESMNSAFINGSAIVYDSNDMLDDWERKPNGWLKGEEEIEIEFEDFYGDTFTAKFFLYAITDLEIPSPSNQTIFKYKLNFVSKEKFYANRQSIKRAFQNDTIKEYVQTIYDDIFEPVDSKEMYMGEEDDTTTMSLIVPNYTADETMHFFSRKAYSKKYPTQTFRFFESKDGFYFGTMSQIVDEFKFGLGPQRKRLDGNTPPIFVSPEYADQSPDGQLRLMSTIVDIRFPVYVNTIEDMNSGAYYSEVEELDFLNRKTNPSRAEPFKYLDELSNLGIYDLPARTQTISKHSRDFVDEHMSDPKTTLVIKDYNREGETDSKFLRPNTYYDMMYNDKRVHFYHHINESIEMTIYGRSKLTVGDIIELDLKEVNAVVDDRKKDEKRSGFYIIESMSNVFYEDQYTQKLIISRSGYEGRENAVASTISEGNET